MAVERAPFATMSFQRRSGIAWTAVLACDVLVGAKAIAKAAVLARRAAEKDCMVKGIVVASGDMLQIPKRNKSIWGCGGVCRLLLVSINRVAQVGIGGEEQIRTGWAQLHEDAFLERPILVTIPELVSRPREETKF